MIWETGACVLQMECFPVCGCVERSFQLMENEVYEERCSLGQPNLPQKLSLSMFLSSALSDLGSIAWIIFSQDESFPAACHRNPSICPIPPGSLSPTAFPLVWSRLCQTLSSPEEQMSFHLVPVLCTVPHLFNSCNYNLQLINFINLYR